MRCTNYTSFRPEYRDHARARTDRPDDDGIVALEDAMSERRSVHDYLAGREEMRRWNSRVGRVCEPPAAAFFD